MDKVLTHDEVLDQLTSDMVIGVGGWIKLAAKTRTNKPHRCMWFDLFHYSGVNFVKLRHRDGNACCCPSPKSTLVPLGFAFLGLKVLQPSIIEVLVAFTTVIATEWQTFSFGVVYRFGAPTIAVALWST